jgi:WD40 repeat protein
LTVGLDHSLRLWDIQRQELLQTMKEEGPDIVWTAAFTPDGKQILTGRGGILKENNVLPGTDFRISIWDAATGKLSRRLAGSPGEVRTIIIANDGKSAVSAGPDETAHRWNLDTGEVAGSFEVDKGNHWCLIYSHDCSHIFYAGAVGIIHEVEAATGKPVRMLQGHTTPVKCLAASPDGKWLASGSLDQTVRVWDLTQRKEKKKLVVGETGIGSVAWSPDGRRILTTSGLQWRLGGGWTYSGRDYVMRLFDVESQRLIASYDCGRVITQSAEFFPQGNKAVLFCGDGSARIFELPP